MTHPKGSRKRGKSRRSGLRSPGAEKSPAKTRRSGTPTAALISDILELYRPLKKPITVRIDADVLAWFKKDGSRYQTRLNRALRQVMEREMKSERN